MGWVARKITPPPTTRAYTPITNTPGHNHIPRQQLDPNAIQIQNIPTMHPQHHPSSTTNHCTTTPQMKICLICQHNPTHATGTLEQHHTDCNHTQIQTIKQYSNQHIGHTLKQIQQIITHLPKPPQGDTNIFKPILQEAFQTTPTTTSTTTQVYQHQHLLHEHGLIPLSPDGSSRDTQCPQQLIYTGLLTKNIHNQGCKIITQTLKTQQPLYTTPYIIQHLNSKAQHNEYLNNAIKKYKTNNTHTSLTPHKILTYLWNTLSTQLLTRAAATQQVTDTVLQYTKHNMQIHDCKHPSPNEAPKQNKHKHHPPNKIMQHKQTKNQNNLPSHNMPIEHHNTPNRKSLKPCTVNTYYANEMHHINTQTPPHLPTHHYENDVPTSTTPYIPHTSLNAGS